MWHGRGRTAAAGAVRAVGVRGTAGVVCLLGLLATGCPAGAGPDGRSAPAAAAAGVAPRPHAAAAPTPRGSGDWRLDRRARAGRIEAFATRTDGPPGTRLGLAVSTTAATYRVSAYRIGAYAGGWGALVWRSGLRPGRSQPPAVLYPRADRTVVAPWRPGLRIDTSGWTAGFYVLKLRTGSGAETQVPYVVSSTTTAGTVALVAPVTTWQAYNQWGGYSLYRGPVGDRRSWAVSFDRPDDGAPGANDYRTSALPIVVRAERLGIPLSYLTNLDVDARPGVLQGARGYVSLGHDEYWTTGMRRAVLRARDAGTNVAFLGANTMYWRIRLEQRAPGVPRRVVGYRSDAGQDPLRAVDPADTTARFRDPPVPRPERQLVGMEYECYPVDARYRVASPRWWGFRGTGVRYGTSFGGLVGPEADRVYPGRGTPRPLEVLSHTTYPCAGVPTSSESVYYTVPSGAGVFTAGTLRWGCALIDACDHGLSRQTMHFVAAVTDNVLRAFARGPVGRSWPARDNVDLFHLSRRNSVPTS